eukprot:GSChrysophyteH1.ASY1.ANO1.2537.1 assembled CDS
MEIWAKGRRLALMRRAEHEREGTRSGLNNTITQEITALETAQLAREAELRDEFADLQKELETLGSVNKTRDGSAHSFLVEEKERLTKRKRNLELQLQSIVDEHKSSSNQLRQVIKGNKERAHSRLQERLARRKANRGAGIAGVTRAKSRFRRSFVAKPISSATKVMPVEKRQNDEDHAHDIADVHHAALLETKAIEITSSTIFDCIGYFGIGSDSMDTSLRDFLSTFGDKSTTFVNELRDSEGNSLLIKAVKHQNLQACKFLTTMGADVTLCNNKGESALHYAASSGHVGIVTEILQRVPTTALAFITAKDVNGRSAADYAMFQSHRDVVDMLVQRGVDRATINAELPSMESKQRTTPHVSSGHQRWQAVAWRVGMRRVQEKHISAHKWKSLVELNRLRDAMSEQLLAKSAHSEGVASKTSELEQQVQRLPTKRKQLHNTIEDMKGAVRVFCRIRPLSSSELARGCHSIIDYLPDKTSLVAANGKQFSFDAVYSPLESQENIFADVCRLVQSAVDGYNVCVFAYGQTGSGKTYTMAGSTTSPGLMPRAVNELFRIVLRDSDKISCQISIEMMEIYLDELVDLLDDRKGHLAIHKDSSGRVTQMDSYIATGSGRRHVTNSVTHLSTVGKLCLVDLAGSESQKKTGATGQTLKEANAINKSLSSLGNVISALTKGVQHVPYRDSKLTALLQDGLGGSAKTLMFVNASPADYNFHETCSSLEFALRCKKVKNQKGGASVETAEVRKLRRELARLKESILQSSRRRRQRPDKMQKRRRRRRQQRDTKPDRTNQEPLTLPTGKRKHKHVLSLPLLHKKNSVTAPCGTTTEPERVKADKFVQSTVICPEFHFTMAPFVNVSAGGKHRKYGERLRENRKRRRDLEYARIQKLWNQQLKYARRDEQRVRRKRTSERQKALLKSVAIALSVASFGHILRRTRRQRRDLRRKSDATSQVQLLWRQSYHRRTMKKHRRTSMILQKRAWIARLNVRTRKRARDSGIIRFFVREAAKVGRFAAIIRKFRYKVAACQGYCRGFLRCQHARLHTMLQVFRHHEARVRSRLDAIARKQLEDMRKRQAKALEREARRARNATIINAKRKKFSSSSLGKLQKSLAELGRNLDSVAYRTRSGEMSDAMAQSVSAATRPSVARRKGSVRVSTSVALMVLRRHLRNRRREMNQRIKAFATFGASDAGDRSTELGIEDMRVHLSRTEDASIWQLFQEKKAKQWKRLHGRVVVVFKTLRKDIDGLIEEAIALQARRDHEAAVAALKQF